MSLTLARSHVEAQGRIRRRVELGVASAWSSLGSYDEADVGPLLGRVVPLIRAGQGAAVTTLQAYLARTLGRPPADIDVAEILENVRGGVPLEEVYRRPFVEVWSGLKSGGLWTDATAAGLDRATVMSGMDVQLAMTHAARAIGGSDDGIYGWQRVANAGACDLCLVASTQRYHSDQLMPIHGFCKCGIAPLTEPTGQIINRGRYEELKSGGRIDDVYKRQRAARYEKRAAGNQSTADKWRARSAAATDPDTAERYALRAQDWQRRADEQSVTANGLRESARAKQGVEVRVREHGELGPILTNADHEFDLHA